MRTVVYLSGPITLGNPQENFAQAARAQEFLMDCGFAVINPMLTMGLPEGLLKHLTHDDWMENDLPIVQKVDAVLRLPGESRGADTEVAFAQENEIPVFYDLRALIEVM
jgi:hypothetical protein